MRRNTLLVGAAGLLLLVTAAVYGWRWAAQPQQRPAEDLARIALTGSDLREKQQAAGELASSGEPGVPHMVRVLGETKVPEVRATMIQGVALQWDYDSMPAILDALNDESLVVRLRAGEAAHRMISVNVGYRAEDPPEKRRAAAARYRQEWATLKDSAVLQLWKNRLEKKGIGRGAR